MILAAALLAGCGPAVAPSEPLPAVDGARALEETARVVALGPRVAGTAGAERAAAYLVERLAALGLEPRLDRFEEEAPAGRMTFRNVSARLPGSEAGLVLLVSHYDTKGDVAPDFAGANDSGSSTGLLLELARVLRAQRRGPELEFLFVDGEECRVAYGPRDGLHGSRRRAAQLRASGEARQVRAVLVLDMIGDRDLTVTLPRNGTPALLRAILAAAEEEGLRDRFRLGDGAILDDHVPFLDAGLPAVDLIDFEYGIGPSDNRYWHTPDDTLDKLSADSLELVGRVVLRFLRAEGVNGASRPPSRFSLVPGRVER